MLPLLAVLRARILPALLTALGVVLVTAGLLSYADPATAGLAVEESPTSEVLSPSAAASPSAGASPSGEPSAAASESPSEPAPGDRAVATRVVVPALRIDLPVVKGPDGYPLCNVAMYIQELGQPGEGRATYLYAHARDGMFGPIYELAHAGQQRKMLGMIVQVYTSDDKLYLYEVREVRIHQLNLDAAQAATTEELWLQTSEGPKGTPGKTQLVAIPISVGDADPADAHPKAKPVVCG
jgi:sortase (surface protein transpeptidase)